LPPPLLIDEELDWNWRGSDNMKGVDNVIESELNGGLHKPVFGESAAIERSTSVKKATRARCRLLVHELHVRAQVSGKG
jgi:hypothetical protein